MSQQDRLDELNVVERPLLRQLGVMGWTHVEGADEDPSTGRKDYHLLGRDTFQQTVLRDRLEAALRRLNRNDDGSEWLDERRISQAISQLERPTSRDFIAINEELHDRIVRGVNVSGPDGEHERRVRFIGFEPDDENEFVAVNQFRVDPPGAVGHRGFIVPDIVLFVNGLPLVVIEAKSPAVTDPVAAAIDQMRRYANRRVPEENEGAERLFWTNHLLVAAAHHTCRVGSISARPNDFLPWRDVYPASMSLVREELGKSPGEGLTLQETLAAGLLRPSHLLDTLRSFTVFMTTDSGVRIKVIPRYHQYRAVHLALDRLATGKTRKQDGMTDRRGGIIWHTQGSGKSLTMVFLIRRMRTMPSLRQFKVAVVTDRTDLQDQLSTTAELTGRVMRTAKSAKKARAFLSRQEPDLVFVMLQKLRDRDRGAADMAFSEDDDDATNCEATRIDGAVDPATTAPFPVLNNSEDILVLIDEAHRSHTSGLHINLLEALPNAARIGFTGTPIEEKKKKTTEIFGNYIDRYLLRDAEEDGAIVKILYEGREPKADIGDKTTLDALFEATFSDRSSEEREAIKRSYVTRSRVFNASQPFKEKANDILRHYVAHIMPNGFKAQIVAASRELAVEYVSALADARDQLVAEITSNAAVLASIDPEAAIEAGGEVAFLVSALSHLDLIRKLDFAAVISAEQNDLPALTAWSGVSDTKTRVERFKRPLNVDPLAFLIVKNKLLTGFDAPVEQALYIDRALSGAELLQAIARTNRTAGPAKRFGIVIDYHGVGSNLSAALALYDVADQEDIGGGIGHPEDIAPELRQIQEELVQHFRNAGIDRTKNLQTYADARVANLKDMKSRARFLSLLKKFVGLFDTLMPRLEAREFISDVKLYTYIAKVASNLYRDETLDVRGLAGKVQAMLDAHILSQGVDPKISPIRILDPGFASSVARKDSDRARAAEMENAIRHRISIAFDQDPAKYEALSQRLDAILANHRKDWGELARQLERLVHDIVDDAQDPRLYSGLAPRTEAPIFALMRTRSRTEDRDVDLAELATDIVERLRNEAAVQGFWDNPVSQEAVRRAIVPEVDRLNLFAFEDLDRISSEIMSVARANRSAYTS